MVVGDAALPSRSSLARRRSKASSRKYVGGVGGDV